MRARHCFSDLCGPLVSVKIPQSPCSIPQIISFAMNMGAISFGQKGRLKATLRLLARYVTYDWQYQVARQAWSAHNEL
tara:strand:- start:51 stop:284 length:234 start_codon:yes stop_codon:yes gene_type:complete